MLISGFGNTYDPKKGTIIDAVVAACKRYAEVKGKPATHVSIPKATSEEDKKFIVRGLGLYIASAKYGSSMVLAGVATEDNHGLQE